MDPNQTDSINGRAPERMVLVVLIILGISFLIFLIVTILQFAIIACASLDTAIAFMRSFWFLILSLVVPGIFLLLISDTIWVNPHGNKVIPTIDALFPSELTPEEGGGTRFIIFTAGAAPKLPWQRRLPEIDVEREQYHPCGITDVNIGDTILYIDTNIGWKPFPRRLSKYLQVIDDNGIPTDILKLIGSKTNELVEVICSAATDPEHVRKKQALYTSTIQEQINDFAIELAGINVVEVTFDSCKYDVDVQNSKNRKFITNLVNEMAAHYIDEFKMDPARALELAGIMYEVRNLNSDRFVVELAGNPEMITALKDMDPASIAAIVQAFNKKNK